MYNQVFIEIYSVALVFPALMTYIDFFYYLNQGKRVFRWGQLYWNFSCSCCHRCCYTFPTRAIVSEIILSFSLHHDLSSMR